jgi:outer membrane protein OmpA-like peptidoglycan-associated protein
MVRSGILAVATVFALSSGVGAYTPPTETGESGLLTIPTTDALPPGQISVGAYIRRDIHDANREEPAVGGVPRDTDMTQANFVGGIGLFEGFEFTFQVPYDAFQIDQPGESTDPRELGQVRVTPKYRLFQEGNSTMPFSLALMGSAHLPTGSEDFPNAVDRNSTFQDELTWEVMGILDKELFSLPGDTAAVLSLNVGGFFFPEDFDEFDINQQTEPVFSQLRRKGFPNIDREDVVLQYGGGLKIPLWKDYAGEFDLTGEYRGNTGVYDELDDYQQVLAGFRYMVWNGLAVHGGVDFALSNDNEKYDVLAGVSFTGPQAKPAYAEPGKSKIVYRDRVIEVEKVLFQDVNFEFDKATLTDLGRGRCYLIAQKLREGKNVKVEVQGHTDYIGTDEYNKALGLKRAETVKAELIRLGVDPASVSSVSYGEEKPLIDKQTPWARAVNRRAEFVVVGEPSTTTRAGEPSEAPPADAEEMPPAAEPLTE